MKQIYEVLFLDHESGRMLKKFSADPRGIPNKYFWEKLKQQELTKLTKRLVVEPSDILVVDISTGVEREN